MRYRRLAGTDAQISEIGFGTIPILSGSVPVLPDYFQLEDDEAVALMKHAWSLGCNFFDTAIIPEYGDAERKLGMFADIIDRSTIYIADKARFYEGSEMYQAVCQSCETLGTYADIYFVHQVDKDKEEVVFGKYGAVDALTDLKKEGKIRWIGIASHSYEILLRAARDKRIDVLQGSGNILERGMLERMETEPMFRKKGWIVNKVLAAGILPNFFSVEELIDGVLSFPVASALIGLGTMEQVNTAMGNETDGRAKRNGYGRPAFWQVLQRLEKEFYPIPCKRCQRCQCAFSIEPHILFRQYNYYFLGKENWALRKLEQNICESAEQCKKCVVMSCKRECPQKIDIPAQIEKIRALAETHGRNGALSGQFTQRHR